MTLPSFIDAKAMRKHYLRRLHISKALRGLLSAKKDAEFAQLALGIDISDANYSASEHRLGEKILSQASFGTIVNLAKKFEAVSSRKAVREAIFSASVPWLKISVGTEIAMLLRPSRFWVANTRTVWAHLAVKHNLNYALANEELSYYRHGDETSLMAYRKWAEIHESMRATLPRIKELGDELAVRSELEPGRKRYIWIDAVANAMYEKRALLASTCVSHR